MRRVLIVAISLAVIAVSCSRSEPVAPFTVPDQPTPTSVATPSTTGAVGSTIDPTTASTISPATTPLPIEDIELALELVASGFTQPVLVTAPVGDDRLFVVDQPGRIWVIDDGDPEEYLDIREDVTFRGERGLLGLAFAPDFAESGVFYLDYTDNGGSTVVASFVADADASSVDPATQTIHLTVDQPASNHNGGNLAFGPEGHLWIGMGDGGGANDRFDHGQRPSSQLGAMLRISPTPDGFTTPERSPAITTEGADGVWAIGLRNPWRFAFDGDLLYVADVGQGDIEEISVVDVRAIDTDPRECVGCVPLPNFGWPIQEGSECFRRSVCDTADLIQPILEYSHGEGCSITGGFVYRGEAIPSLRGHYLYGDWCDGWVRSFRFVPAVGDIVDRIEWFKAGTVPRLTSFGMDGAGELYVLSASGDIFLIVVDG